MHQQTMRRIITFSFMLLLLTLAAAAQQAAIGFCALDKTLDFKTAKAGDKDATSSLTFAPYPIPHANLLNLDDSDEISAGRPKR